MSSYEGEHDHQYEMVDNYPATQHNYINSSRGHVRLDSTNRVQRSASESGEHYSYPEFNNYLENKGSLGPNLNHSLLNSCKILCVLLMSSFIVGISLGVAGTFFLGLHSSAGNGFKEHCNLTCKIPSVTESPKEGIQYHEYKTFFTSQFYQLPRCEIGNQIFQDKNIAFTVTTCADVHVILTSSYGGISPLVEIAVGLNHNTLSAIRKTINDRAVSSYTGSLLDCRKPVKFRISWEDSHINVGLENSRRNHSFMRFKDQRNLDIQNVGISSGPGETAEWNFKISN